MDDQILVSMFVEEIDGEFFFGPEGAVTTGPYPTEEAATEALTRFLEEKMTQLVERALGDTA